MLGLIGACNKEVVFPIPSRHTHCTTAGVKNHIIDRKWQKNAVEPRGLLNSIEGDLSATNGTNRQPMVFATKE